MTTENYEVQDYLVFYKAPTLMGAVESIREGEGWTKREMAKKLGVSEQYYNDFTHGKKPVSAKKAQQWAVKLGYGEKAFIKLALDDTLKRFDLNYTVELKEGAAC
jgi:transcriptional regulator with XRE-family HTH domain